MQTLWFSISCVEMRDFSCIYWRENKKSQASWRCIVDLHIFPQLPLCIVRLCVLMSLRSISKLTIMWRRQSTPCIYQLHYFLQFSNPDFTTSISEAVDSVIQNCPIDVRRPLYKVKISNLYDEKNPFNISFSWLMFFVLCVFGVDSV